MDSAEWAEQVLSMASERFERRLAQEMAALRVDMAHHETGLRQELHGGLTGVRQEMANTRVEIVRWSFVFWIGQVAATATLLAFMLRVR
jgi:hypothetical protein